MLVNVELRQQATQRCLAQVEGSIAFAVDQLLQAHGALLGGYR